MVKITRDVVRDQMTPDDIISLLEDAAILTEIEWLNGVGDKLKRIYDQNCFLRDNCVQAREEVTKQSDEIIRLRKKNENVSLRNQNITQEMAAAGVMALIDAGLDGPDGVGPSDAKACFQAMLEEMFT